MAAHPLDLLITMSHPPELNVPPHLQPGTRLPHYKGGLYRVEGACLIDTMKTGILYRPELGTGAGVWWMRPASAFNEMVSTDEGSVTRFTVL